MTAQKLMMTITTAIGGAVGLLAPIGFVKWLLRTDPEEAGILTLFFFPVWCLLVEKSLSQIPSSQIATMVPSVARPLMVHPVA